MGTTCTALVLSGHFGYSCHIGDSRIYLIRAGVIYQMTEDHSEVMKLVREGIISLEQARRHEDRNVLFQVLGTQPNPSFSTWPKPLPIHSGDRFLLCTDGLHDLVEADEMRVRAQELSPEVACRSLVDLARERGGYDNITVAIAAVGLATVSRETKVRETRVAEAIR
jgi:protein phosphatase